MHKVIRYVVFSAASLYTIVGPIGVAPIGIAPIGIAPGGIAFAGGLKTTGSISTSTDSSVPVTSNINDADNSAANISAVNANINANAGVSSTDADIETDIGDGFIAIEDDPLIVDTSAIMDDDGMGEVSIQWQVAQDSADWTNIAGATQQSFTPRESHVGHQLRVVITFVDGQGNLETLTSPASSTVQNVNDKPTGSPIITGLAREEEALVVDTSTVDDEDGIGAYEVVWQRSSTKTEWQTYPAVTGEVLRLGQEQVGFSYRAVITYLDNHGTREVLISNPSEVVLNVDDPVEGEVILTGEAIEGGRMTVETKGVSDEDGIASLSLSWEYSEDGRNWRARDTSFTSVINLDQSLVGLQIRAKASVVDTFGVETSIYSQPTNTIKNINNNPSGKIDIRRVGS
jgi:hypothetical protein